MPKTEQILMVGGRSGDTQHLFIRPNERGGEWKGGESDRGVKEEEGKEGGGTPRMQNKQENGLDRLVDEIFRGNWAKGCEGEWKRRET